jgi:hypothetical protein
MAMIIGSTGCKKEELFSNVPSIRLNSVSPTVVKELEDPIFFDLEYTDGDGDLGENDPDAKNLIVIDPRINIKYEFRIQQLVPDPSNVPIKGTLVFSIPNAYITDGSNQQQVNYQIYVKDRAGNQSNTVTSSTITINK